MVFKKARHYALAFFYYIFRLMTPLWIYKKTMKLGTPFLKAYLSRRVRQGKEDPARLNERMGIASLPRPSGPLVWVHVASVGEAQSILSFVDLMLTQNPSLNILVTSVTKTSAGLLAQKLPNRAFHQYAPVDHPDWIRQFLDHWNPNMALWVESELWPTMLNFLKKRHIPAALLNAHMSPNSYRNWKRAPKLIKQLLSVFLVILAQSKQDAEFYSDFTAHNVVTTDNIKYAAKPLPYDEQAFIDLTGAIGSRPVWLYASTHDGEEELAAQVHKTLSKKWPDILTIIAPRHPDRRDSIGQVIENKGLRVKFRGTDKKLPDASDQVYITDTMGELGLLYKLVPLAVIGRSFSNDGGGGHNPIEAALLDCAVLHGPNVQNMSELFTEMDEVGAAMEIKTKEDFVPMLSSLFEDKNKLEELRKLGTDFASTKANVFASVLEELEPVFLEAHLPPPKVAA